ncbi:MAG TPA: metallophosphoesterase [Bacteroidia bacterium]|nr:metallophosphoesterase [Bacteroidia bacterium]
MKISSILFASDLHGSDIVFRRLIDTAIKNKVEAVLIGGDISGKTLTPIIKRVGGKYETKFLGRNKVVSDGTELSLLQQDIANSGSYSYIVDENDYRKLDTDKVFRAKIFLEQMKLRAKQWIAIAEERLKPKGIRFVIICGNDDDRELDHIIANSSFAENPEKKVITICDNHEVIGESSANKTPFNCPRDIEEDEIESNLRMKLKDIKDVGRSILIIHTPPINSSLDNAPALDKDLKPIVEGGSHVFKPVGSSAVRKIIEEVQPMLTLHGHIHESPGFCKIGRTYCFNPGSEYNNACLRSYLITMDRDSVKGHFLIKL